MKDSKKTEEGITVKKAENFSEWYTQVLQKAELMDYTAVSGSIVIRPSAGVVVQRWHRYDS